MTNDDTELGREDEVMAKYWQELYHNAKPTELEVKPSYYDQILCRIAEESKLLKELEKKARNGDLIALHEWRELKGLNRKEPSPPPQRDDGFVFVGLTF